MLSKKLNVGIEDISKMIIWGNHSPTMYPDFENIVSNGELENLINDMNWVNDEFLPIVQQEGNVIDSRGASSVPLQQRQLLIRLLLIKIQPIRRLL